MCDEAWCGIATLMRWNSEQAALARAANAMGEMGGVRRFALPLVLA